MEGFLDSGINAPHVSMTCSCLQLNQMQETSRSLMRRSCRLTALWQALLMTMDHLMIAGLRIAVAEANLLEQVFLEEAASLQAGESWTLA